MRLAIVVALALASSSIASAQPAQKAFDRGRALLAERKFAEACDAFAQSQQLDPQFGTQYNLAGCYVEIGKLASAINLYRTIARSDTNTDRKQASADEADKLAARVPTIELSLATPIDGLHVTMNGADASALVGYATPIDYGTYVFVATAGERRWTKTIAIAHEQQRATLAIELDAAGTVSEAPHDHHTTAWRGAFIGGAVVAVASSILWIYSYSKIQEDVATIGTHGSPVPLRDITSADCGMTVYEGGEDQAAFASACSRRSWTKVGIAGVAVGALVMGATFYTAWLHGASASITPSASSEGASIRLDIRW